MASDLPPYLTRSPHRNIPWTGHATFPRRSIEQHLKLERKWGKDYLKDLRILKKFDDVYRELTPVEIQHYMDDPTHV